jgi:hypothetical protein
MRNKAWFGILTSMAAVAATNAPLGSRAAKAPAVLDCFGLFVYSFIKNFIRMPNAHRMIDLSTQLAVAEEMLPC